MNPHRLLVLIAAFFFLVCVQVRGAVFTYAATLNGANEAPVNVSAGTGVATVTYNDFLNTLRVQVTFSGLTGVTTAAHIHGPTALAGAGTAGVITVTPTFTGFPLGVTSGSYDNTFDLTLSGSWNPSFITNNGGTVGSAETVLAAALADGKAYFNIHTSVYGGGEIRGFLVPAQTPDAGTTAAMLGCVLMGLAAMRRKQV